MLSALHWRLASVSILAKVLGVGVVVGALFGLYTLVAAQAAMGSVLDVLVRERALSQARDLARLVERPLATGDRIAINQLLVDRRAANGDLRFAIVRGRDGAVLAHTFPGAVPGDVGDGGQAGPVPRQRVLLSTEGRIHEAAVGVLDGLAGEVQVGLIDHSAQDRLRDLTIKLAWGLGLCALLGVGMAFMLADALARPMRALVASAQDIAAGNLAARSPVLSADETGRLAESFNRMAESLGEQREALRAKERDRAALLARLVQATEDERKVIARELHDHLGQLLTAHLLDLQRSRADEAPAVTRERQVGQVGGLIEEVRRLAWAMRPSILDDFGLVTALGNHAEELTRLGRLRVQFQAIGCSDTTPMPSPVAVALYRIAQEALTNCVRHAGASHASLILLRHGAELTLIVEDDGRGMDGSAGNGGCHLGLTNMRERAELVDGRCTVESVLGRGTIVSVVIPLEAESST